MRAHLVVAFVVVLGVGGHGAPGVMRSSIQRVLRRNARRIFRRRRRRTRARQWSCATLTTPRAHLRARGCPVCRRSGPRRHGAVHRDRMMRFGYGPGGAVSRLWTERWSVCSRASVARQIS